VRFPGQTVCSLVKAPNENSFNATLVSLRGPHGTAAEGRVCGFATTRNGKASYDAGWQYAYRDDDSPIVVR